MNTDERRADAVLADLLDRAGIQNELEAVKYSDPETWQDIRQSIARAIRTSDEAAGMVLVPREAIDKVKEIRADLEEFDGDKRGHWHTLQEAEECLVRAMLAAATESDNG